MKILIFGPPGSGKGTYASRLKDKINVTPISTGDIFREAVKEGTELGKNVSVFLKEGVLVPDDLVIEVLRDRLKELSESEGFILDGYPRTIKQAKALDKIAEIDALVQLIVPRKIIVDRLTSRRVCPSCGAIYNLINLKPKIDEICDSCGTPLHHREDDKMEVVMRRLREYEKQSRPILSYYRGRIPFVKIVSRKFDQDPDVIVDRIVKKLRSIGLTE